METLKTIYTVKGRKVKVLWEFHYDIEGYLVEFKILEGRLNDMQLKWLIDPLKFPYRESMIETWKSIKEFIIIVGKPKLTFELFWSAYNYKVKKVKCAITTLFTLPICKNGQYVILLFI